MSGSTKRATIMLLLWILPLYFLPTYQISNLNCLRDHPGALDAEFSLTNRYENKTDINEKDVAKHLSILSTRFKRFHQFTRFNAEMMQVLESGISLFTDISGRNFELFFSASESEIDESYSRALREHKEEYDCIMKVNSGKKGPVAGIYLQGLMPSWKEELKAVETVFGGKENSTFAVGTEFQDCIHFFKKNRALIYLRRLQFISCDLAVVNKPSAEESAEAVIKTCNKIRDFARAVNITAEIRCKVGYPSYGKSLEGVVGSLANFQKFWCRIVRKVTQEPTHARIIMMSAFDETPENYKAKSTDLHAGKFYSGWWRRRVTTSYGPSAFLEKVEELEGSRESRNCTEECSLCNSSDECCEGRTCSTDVSFQPFENLAQPHVCQSVNTNCAPRFPTKSETSSSTQPSQPRKNTLIVNFSSVQPTEQSEATSAERSSVQPTEQSEAMSVEYYSSVQPTEQSEATSAERSSSVPPTQFPITPKEPIVPSLHTPEPTMSSSSFNSGQSAVMRFNKMLTLTISNAAFIVCVWCHGLCFSF